MSALKAHVHAYIASMENGNSRADAKLAAQSVNVIGDRENGLPDGTVGEPIEGKLGFLGAQVIFPLGEGVQLTSEVVLDCRDCRACGFHGSPSNGHPSVEEPRS